MPVSDMRDYQDMTGYTARYPSHNETMVLAYLGLGLAGEAGEVANKVKKLIRDGTPDDFKATLVDELGDVMWYLFRLIDELGCQAVDVASRNTEKLLGRMARGTLSGSGDNR